MITIIPLVRIDKGLLDELKEILGKTFLTTVELEQTLSSLPDDIYDAQRKQYDASKLVEFLLPYLDSIGGDKVLAVCDFDLFVKDMNYIFGIAQKRGKLCIVSLKRLDQKFYGNKADKGKLKKRVLKEAVHEIGHCFGMEHCRNESCVMSFSNNIRAVDNKGDFFCEVCRERLKDKL